MNKYLPYILAFLLSAAVITLFFTGNNKRNRRLDERITLRKKDKIPYGAYVAFQHLRYLFPKASVYTSRREPGYWDSLSNYESKQAYIMVGGSLSATKEELKRMISFAENGNDVFISARYFSAAADEIFNCISSAYDLSLFSVSALPDTMHISLNDPPFGKNSRYSYPGKRFNSFFSKIDSVTTDVLGQDEYGRTNFIHLRAGKGNFYLHMEPLAFSNYFLLHKKNIAYYEKALSVISPDVTKVVWDEYYLYNRSRGEKSREEKNWLNVLFRYPSLKAALLTAIFTLIVFVLLEMRRKQRYIPVIAKPRNDSLDFVKTIGRLYHDKNDHKNLSRKMGAYFLEHVRNRYKLPTGTLDDEFIKLLQFKTGIAEAEIRSIVSFIRYAEDAPAINHKELTDFHKQLESFYKKA